MFFLFYQGTCQQLDNFKPLQSQGKIPQDFIQLSSEIYLNDEQKIDKNESSARIMLRKKYLLQSNFYIEYLLNSGFILFNDSLSNYINGVADNLLKSQPELRKQLRFYLIKSPEVNAFATDKGIIFVTVGLISQIQSEAQLAWILSHEIIHFKYKHNIESYIENQEILRGKGEFAKTDKNVKLSAIFKYSQENESEADSKGLEEFYSKTDYSFTDVKNIFDVLLYSYLPIEEIDFDKSFFETKQFIFPAAYSPSEPKPIIIIEDYDDSESTHPNIKKRREVINNTINKLKNKEGVSYSAFSSNYFNHIRQIARFELCDIYLTNRDYEDAIYTAYAIMQKDSFSNEYLETVIGKGLYGLCKYKNHGNYGDVHLKVKKTEGSKHNLVFLFNEISKKELNVLALSYLWNHKLKYPNNIDFSPLADNVLYDLVFVNKLLPDSFNIQETISESEVITDTLTEAQISKLDKYEKIKYKRKKQITVNTSSSNYNFALSDILKDETFYALFEKYKKEYLIQKEKESAETGYSYNKEEVSKNEKKFGKKLGIDKVVFVNPLVFVSKKEYGKSELDFLKSEKQETLIFEKTKQFANKLGLSVEIIDNKLFTENDVDLFNDGALLSNWIYEQSLNNDTDFYNGISYKLNELAKKHNTNYFAWLYVDTYPAKSNSRFGKFLKYAITGFGFPFGFSELTKSVNFNSFNIILYDVTKSRIVFEETTSSYETANADDLVNSVLYNFFYEIKSKPKKK
ncbi:MAG: hypothetical protein A2X08_17440 [Bacteroidetes bacterium GWA2_32_17]|nr:MAG: hypothetical protein A2X08_17440 [Bacteroidetes bacterium GWA2_32_17]